jgi:hypothetical protein
LKKAALAFVLAVAAAGCAGGGVYPDTDVVEPNGMTLKLATGPLQISGGLLLSGVLEYEGDGDLNLLFRAYLEAMKKNGWAHAGSEVKGDKATGTLGKDTRKCGLSFTAANGKIRAVITVSQAK